MKLSLPALLGFNLGRAISGYRAGRVKALSTVDVTGGGGWFSIIRESFAGAWQAGIAIDAPKQLLAFSAVYACVSLIANDIAKLCIELKEEGDNYVGVDVTPNSPYLPFLLRPNAYQTRFQFILQWVISKLLFGNTYVLVERDYRKIIVAGYVLDPTRVKTLITDSGEVFYRLSRDDLSNAKEDQIVPASSIIHDRMVTLWHPMVGVSPIYACAASATMGNRIQTDSTRFFQNMSMPSGGLTAPGHIDDETANRLKKDFEERFGGSNIGRLFVAGDGLEYKAMKIPAVEAQLIEQLKWTVEDVARCFHMPLFKLGGEIPRGVPVDSLNQTYYSDCLQANIESIEECLDYAMGLANLGYYTEFEVGELLRMDTSTRYTAWSDGVKGGWMSPNEARAKEDLPPVPGGETPYLQQQNFGLAALAKRDSQDDPFESSKPAPNTTPPSSKPDAALPEQNASQQRAALVSEIVAALAAREAPAEKSSDAEDQDCMSLFIKGMRLAKVSDFVVYRSENV
jgi:HK97 family phage portal protein